MLDDHTANWELSKIPVDSEYHVSETNGLFLGWIESLRNHTKELSKDIEAEIQDADDFSSNFAFGTTGMDLYQLCTLTISYFEISSYIFISDELRSAPPSDDTKQLVKAIYSRKSHVLEDSDDYAQRQRNAYKRLQSDQNLNAGFYKSVLKESGIINDNEEKVLTRVKSIRGDLVHNVFQILKIDNKNEAVDLVEDCQFLLEKLSDLLHEYVEYTPEVYNVVVNDI